MSNRVSARHSEVSAQEVAKQMLALLPEDRTPVLNRIMRAMLSRALQRPVEPELYFAARDILLKTHRQSQILALKTQENFADL